MRPLSPSPSRVNLGPDRCRAGFRGVPATVRVPGAAPPGANNGDLAAFQAGMITAVAADDREHAGVVGFWLPNHDADRLAPEDHGRIVPDFSVFRVCPYAVASLQRTWRSPSRTMSRRTGGWSPGRERAGGADHQRLPRPVEATGTAGDGGTDKAAQSTPSANYPRRPFSCPEGPGRMSSASRSSFRTVGRSMKRHVVEGRRSWCAVTYGRYRSRGSWAQRGLRADVAIDGAAPSRVIHRPGQAQAERDDPR